MGSYSGHGSGSGLSHWVMTLDSLLLHVGCTLHMHPFLCVCVWWFHGICLVVSIVCFYHSLFTCSPVGYLACIQYLALLNKAVMNFYVQALESVSVYLR